MLGWTIVDWQNAYREGASPATLLPGLLDGMNQDDAAWITLIDQPYLATVSYTHLTLPTILLV